MDRFGRISDCRWRNTDTGDDVDRIQYGYDRDSSRIWRQNTVAEAAGAGLDEKYTYDLIQRLKSLRRGTLNTLRTAIEEETFAECWSLDATGNWNEYRQDADGDGTWTLEQSRTANKVNEITAITNSVGDNWAQPVYNAAGNMTTIPRQTPPSWSLLTADNWSSPTADGWGAMTVEPVSLSATYDAWNQLVRLVDATSGNTVTEYQYDGAKRRVVEKSYTDGTLSKTRHLYYTEPSRWQIIEERIDSSTNPDQQNVWGTRYIDDLVLRDRFLPEGSSSLSSSSSSNLSLERLYCLQDANWNTTSIANTDGEVQERYAYSAYGVPTFLTANFEPQGSSSFDWSVLYAGYSWSNLAQLYDVRYREYHPLLGIWLQRDPLKYIDSMNIYEYVLSIPLSNTDPTGLALDSVTASVEKCMSLPPAAALACLENLAGTGEPRLEAIVNAAKAKIKHIMRCEATHAAYKALGCKGCNDPAITQAEAKKRAACLSAEISGRSLYLKHRCDYVLAGSMARGSPKAEAGHKIEVAQLTVALSTCLAKSCPQK